MSNTAEFRKKFIFSRISILTSVYLFLLGGIFLAHVSQNLFVGHMTIAEFLTEHYSYITNIQLSSVITYLLLYKIKKSRPFAVKFLTLPIFGLIWIVFLTRSVFEVVS